MIGITIVQFSWILQELQKKTASSLWNYYRDEASNPLSCNSESFKYMRNITGNTYDGNYNPDKAAKNETEVFILLKHFSNFCRSLNILLTNSKIDLILTLSKNCVLTDMAEGAAGNNNDPEAIERSCCYLAKKKNNKKLLEQIKSGFKRTVKWNKYKFSLKITT